MGLFSSLFVFTVLRDALLLILWLASLAGLELGWTALRQASAWWVATLALAATIVGFVNARRLARVVTVDVPIAGLPPDLDGFTIVQISDIHIGPTIKQRYVQAIVDAVNQESPDLVAITGDVVDGSVEQLAAQASPLGQLRAPHGVYLVTGNHEYYSGAAPWVAEFRRMGLRVLMNEHALIHPSGLPMIIAGVTDYSAGAFDPHQRSNPAAAWPARRPMPGHASCWRTSRAARPPPSRWATPCNCRATRMAGSSFPGASSCACSSPIPPGCTGTAGCGSTSAGAPATGDRPSGWARRPRSRGCACARRQAPRLTAHRPGPRQAGRPGPALHAP